MDSKVVTIKDAKKKLIEYSKTWAAEMSSLTFGAVFLKNGTLLQGGGARGCHGWINFAAKESRYNSKTGNYEYIDKTPEWGWVLSVYNGDAFYDHPYPNQSAKRCPKEIQKEFIKWFLSDDNPLSEFVAVRDEDFVYNNGLIINGAKAGWSRTLFLCKVIRQARETPQIPITWLELVKEGIDPWIALLAAQRCPSKMGGMFIPIPSSLHCTSFHVGYNLGLENLLLRKTFKGREGNCDSVFGLTQGGTNPFPSKTIKIDNGWGDFLTQQGLTFENLVEACKKLEQKLLTIKDNVKPLPKKTVSTTRRKASVKNVA